MRGKSSGVAGSTCRDPTAEAPTTCRSVRGATAYARSTMSSLSERLNRGPASSPSQVDHARRLVADWQLLPHLASSDLPRWVPLKTGDWWCVAQGRPLPAPTSQPDDLAGAEASGVVAE